MFTTFPQEERNTSFRDYPTHYPVQKEGFPLPPLSKGLVTNAKLQRELHASKASVGLCDSPFVVIFTEHIRSVVYCSNCSSSGKHVGHD